jgi:alpha-glucosidase
VNGSISGKDPESYLWWQTGVIYQVYPRSFQDTTGNGIGDLEGIRRRMDHLEWLGVDAVWVSPVYPSPMADFGYDISDYTAIHPLFGTMEDMDRLIQEAHGRGLRVIMDLVPNHSSHEHPWFRESRASRSSPTRDWYIWEDPGPAGGPPNNWLSVFGGPAWEWDEATGQYYYHAFLKEQPDLNWRNPEVRDAMLDVMRFWLDRGVDGFRVDVMWHMVKDDQLRDNPPNPDFSGTETPYNQLLPVYSTDQPEVHDIVARMRAVTDAYDERVLIGEIYLPIGKLVAYYGEDGSGAHLPFNFQLVELPWDAAGIYAAITEYEAALPPGGWPNWVLGNHDKSRIASRVGPDQARVAAMLLLTLRGTPTLYFGDEIGMQDGHIPPDRIQDPQALNLDDPSFSRDPQRVPMRWDGSEHGGFTTGQPWLPTGDPAGPVNVEAQRHDPDSMLALHRRLLELRRREPALQVGDYAPSCIHGDAFAFTREHDGRRFLIALNLGDAPATLRPDAPARGTVLVGTDRRREGARVDGVVDLAANEGVVVELEA